MPYHVAPLADYGELATFFGAHLRARGHERYLGPCFHLRVRGKAAHGGLELGADHHVSHARPRSDEHPRQVLQYRRLAM